MLKFQVFRGTSYAPSRKMRRFLHELVHETNESLRLNIYASVRLRFCPPKQLSHGDDWIVMARCNDVSRFVYDIEFNQTIPKKNSLLKVGKLIAHELTHVKQYSRGSLRLSSDQNHFVWKGKKLISTEEYESMSVQEYEMLPFEREAIDAEDQFEELVWHQRKLKDRRPLKIDI